MRQELMTDKVNNDVKLFVSKDTELKIVNLKVQALEAEVKVLKHIINMYANHEIYTNI